MKAQKKEDFEKPNTKLIKSQRGHIGNMMVKFFWSPGEYRFVTFGVSLLNDSADGVLYLAI